MTVPPRHRMMRCGCPARIRRRFRCRLEGGRRPPGGSKPNDCWRMSGYRRRACSGDCEGGRRRKDRAIELSSPMSVHEKPAHGNHPSFVANPDESWSTTCQLGAIPHHEATDHDTKTTDVAATVEQISGSGRSARPGLRPHGRRKRSSSSNSRPASPSWPTFTSRLLHVALKVAECRADCLRINPGNIGNERAGAMRRWWIAPIRYSIIPHRCQRRFP